MKKAKNPPLDRMLEKVERYAKSVREPYVTEEARVRRDPFRVLISCVLSLRTKDDATAAARLWVRSAVDEFKGADGGLDLVGSGDRVQNLLADLRASGPRE